MTTTTVLVLATTNNTKILTVYTNCVVVVKTGEDLECTYHTCTTVLGIVVQKRATGSTTHIQYKRLP
jgi:hypothetical protein